MEVSKMKKQSLLMVLLMCLVFGSSVVFGKAVTGVAILNQAIGVRQLGMGEVATGLSDDAAAMHYNPAGIATVRNIELNAMYHQNIIDTRNEALNLIYPLKGGLLLGNKASIGLGVLAYQGGDIEWIQLNPDETIKSRETLKAESDYQIGLCYAQEIASFSGNTYVGVMVKWIQSKLVEEYTAGAFGIDMGVLHKVGGFGLGMALQNMGTGMKFIEVADSLPFTIRLGGSYERKLGKIVKMVAGVDGIKIKNDDMRYNLGGECWIADILGIRAGYKIKDEDKVSIGASIRYKWVQLDYGYKMMDVFSNTHQVAITLRMGSPEISKQAKIKQMKKHYMRATTYYKKRMYKEAISEWEKVLKIDPNHKQSKEAIEKAKKKMEQTAKK
ncbi:MAG: PorV/PorQ family protein [Clostridia bacterium]|nr:PorV/PorQ family protein [Clostridia bacterium]